MTQLLAGDIGGTKTILRLFLLDDRSGDGMVSIAQAEYPSQTYGDLVPLVQDFLTMVRQQGHGVNPLGACFALAGPVVNQRCRLTNLRWDLSHDRLAQDLNLHQVTLINDFVGVGYGVLGLGPEQLCYLQQGTPDPSAPIGVLGAGTGLGECFLAPWGGGEYRAYATEGGHTDFAPRSPLEFALRQYLLERDHLERVSVERVVSGQGIVAIYQFLRDHEGRSEDATLGAKIRDWEQEKTPDLQPGGLIAQAAHHDPLCQETLQLFMDAYAVEAGNVALKLLPQGGLYLAGGIAPKNLPWLQNDRFLQLLKAKGRVSGVLDDLPIAVVLAQDVGLIGAAIKAKQDWLARSA